MNKTGKATILSFAVMNIVLIVCDVKKWIQTPLSPYGANHWVPELATIFLMGRLFATRIKKILLYTIVGCLFLYPVLMFSLIGQTTFGIGTSSLFVSVFLMGLWSGTKKEVK